MCLRAVYMRVRLIFFTSSSYYAVFFSHTVFIQWNSKETYRNQFSFIRDNGNGGCNGSAHLADEYETNYTPFKI